MTKNSVLKRVILWLFVLAPMALGGLMVLLVGLALFVIHVTHDAEAFAGAMEPIRQLARDVYERHRSIWQAQSDCIVFDEVLFYKPRPGLCEFKNVEFSTVLTFDEMGFRQSGLSDEKVRRPTHSRIVVLGDSQAMGWGVQDHETFAAVLAHEYGFEVFNLAVSSYGTARELLRLQKEFSLQQDDIVVIQYHPNDLSENLAFQRNDGRLPHHSPSDLARLKHTPQDYGVLQVTASVFFILKGKLIHAVSGSSESEGDGRHVETFLAVVNRFPFLYKARVLVCEVNSFGLATSFADELERAADGRIGVLKPVWEPGDFYNLDPHLTPAGHRRVARVIADAIMANSAGVGRSMRN